jgi:hypothetical protein
LLYADTNGDGDLADEKPSQGKRESIRHGDVEYARLTFEVALPGNLGVGYECYDDPAVGDDLFLYRNVTKVPFPRNDFHQCACGEGGKEFRFAQTREDCPVFRLPVPLTMLRFGVTALPVGGQDDLPVRVGSHGDGSGTRVSWETGRVPKGVHPVAEIVFPGKRANDPTINALVGVKGE